MYQRLPIIKYSSHFCPQLTIVSCCHREKTRDASSLYATVNYRNHCFSSLMLAKSFMLTNSFEQAMSLELTFIHTF